MLSFIARHWARTRYAFNQLTEAATNDLNAGLALRTADEKRKLAGQLTEQADQMDARIKEVAEMEEKGFYSCENGHEGSIGDLKGSDQWVCSVCYAPAKYIKRDQMIEQEKYESDRERKDAEDLAKAKRDQAKAEEEGAGESEKAAKYFKGLAQSNRSLADKIRKL